MTLKEELFNIQDLKYRDFCIKLTPGVDPNTFIGVRIPLIREIAKRYKNTIEEKEFLNSLPHYYYEENLLHSAFLSQMKDYNECISYIEKFLPYIDNWAVCDTLNPKVFKKNRSDLIIHIKSWLNSKDTYTIRYAVDMLMSHYLDEDYKDEYLNLVSNIRSSEYYINMVVAWYFATALAKQYDKAIKIIENKCLDKWTHNKTIQKAIESYRISDIQKEYLRTLKIK